MVTDVVALEGEETMFANSKTQDAIKKIAYYTARDAKGKRKQDAIAHCKKLGVDYTAPSFAEAVK